MTQLGFEITESVLKAEWSTWRRNSSLVPSATGFTDVSDYFFNGVGKACAEEVVRSDEMKADLALREGTARLLVAEELEAIKELPHREYKEGRKRLVQHARLERIRNPALVRDAKRAFKKKHGRFFCEACGFDFEAVYGKRGKDYIEAHHRKPISEVDEAIVLIVGDLSMVCSNCHRMLHRVPWITVEELSSLLK